MQLLEESLSISRGLNDYAGMAMAMIQLGEAHQYRQNFEKAQAHLQQAAEISSTIKNGPLAAQAWLQLGELATEQHLWEEAQRRYETSLEAIHSLDAMEIRALVLQRLGETYYAQEKYEEAKETVAMTARLHQYLEDWEGYAENIYELACIAIKLGQVSEAKRLANESIAVFQELGSPRVAEIEVELATLVP